MPKLGFDWVLYLGYHKAKIKVLPSRALIRRLWEK